MNNRLTPGLWLTLIILTACNQGGGNQQESIETQSHVSENLGDGDLNVGQGGRANPQEQSMDELMTDEPMEELPPETSPGGENAEGGDDNQVEVAETSSDEDAQDDEQDTEPVAEPSPAPKVKPWSQVDAVFEAAILLGDLDLSYCQKEVLEFEGCSKLESRAQRQANRFQEICKQQALISYRAANTDKHLKIVEIKRRLAEEIPAETNRHDRVTARLARKIERISANLDKRILKLENRLGKIDSKLTKTYQKAAKKQCVLLPAAQEGNHVENGSFEATDLGGSSWNIFTSEQVPAWNIEWNHSEACDGNRAPSVEIQKAFVLGRSIDAADGNQYLELDSDCKGRGSKKTTVTMSQIINTIPGRTYEISFAFRARPGNRGNQALAVNFGDTEVYAEENIPNTQDWLFESIVVTATSFQTTISFSDFGDANTFGTLLDDVAVMDITE
ncbi:hypothetical protein [Pseudobacteriovorax antillogorgiicola]|uniref:Uncharacterized protein n=1 Tax=Pseudobacteriovorax antillogorgiicola TaxID=1513793 RepID=A0A1Y6CE47_9BACT|nr:hypothetical protein [Pseudobacteriovorax antillogorgiicola]TCS48304.1 hypothetical protein EDD56_11884 [Pseudobacteriovorax antillogorgiicola]SMF56763.1 hypothetical protein SAMN06296036_11857 [Pseudobacteriovorax antillogorgiicola]